MHESCGDSRLGCHAWVKPGDAQHWWRGRPRPRNAYAAAPAL